MNTEKGADNTKDSPAVHKTLTLNLAQYEDQLDDAELSEDEREELLKALWTIICCFVDIGYRIETPKSCGQLAIGFEAPANVEIDPVDSKDQQTRTTMPNAGPALRLAEQEGR